MGNKRKIREEEEARITKKIKRLEKKLQRRRRVISTDDSGSEINEQILPDLTPMHSPAISEVNLDMPSLMSPMHQTSPSAQTSVEVAISEPGPSCTTVPSTTPNQDEETLEEDILQILGEAPQPDTDLGKNIHKDIASRWQDILLKGLSKDIKEPLLKRYLIPANCSLLVAPLLNPEAKAAVSDILVKRDGTLLQKQNQIGMALAALSELTEMIIRNESSKQILMQPLSDACRLLCDSHYIETKTRRSIIMSSMNTSLRDTLTNTNRDKFLFGEELADKLKAAKSIQKTGESLLRPTPVVSSSKNQSYRGMPKNRNLNARGPIQRKPPNRNESTRGRAPARLARTTTYVRQPPPPPKASSPARRNYRR